MQTFEKSSCERTFYLCASLVMCCFCQSLHRKAVHRITEICNTVLYVTFAFRNLLFHKDCVNKFSPSHFYYHKGYRNVSVCKFYIPAYKIPLRSAQAAVLAYPTAACRKFDCICLANADCLLLCQCTSLQSASR